MSAGRGKFVSVIQQWIFRAEYYMKFFFCAKLTDVGYRGELFAPVNYFPFYIELGVRFLEFPDMLT